MYTYISIVLLTYLLAQYFCQWQTTENTLISKQNIDYSPLRFKLLHDIQEVIVHLWLVTKLQLDLVKIRQCIFNLGNYTYVRTNK